MPGIIWTSKERDCLRSCVNKGLTARTMKVEGLFAGKGTPTDPHYRSAMSIQKQMQRMGLADPVRSAIIKHDRAHAWEGKDRNACVADLLKNWKHTRVDVFAANWGVSPSTIKYLLKQRGIGLTWKQAIHLKESPFLDPEKRRQWGNQLREFGRKRREQRRKQLILDGREILKQNASIPRRRCVGCRNVFPVNRDFFRGTLHQGRTYYSHLCKVCSCERSSSGNGDENLMVRRNRERLLALRERHREQGQLTEERDCRKCFQSWPLDKRFFKYTRSKHTGRLLFDHVCRLCHAEKRRRRARRAKRNGS